MNGYRERVQERTRGLSDAEVEASRRAHGTNKLTEQRGKSFLGRFFFQLE
ncbi:MAG: hypothetical protein J6B71_06030 [Clostridia bacterium]|nr:hypothetical protein [Clostridia bacterium]